METDVIKDENDTVIGTLSGFDIKAQDDTLFADIKNKHNTMRSRGESASFQNKFDT